MEIRILRMLGQRGMEREGRVKPSSKGGMKFKRRLSLNIHLEKVCRSRSPVRSMMHS